MKQSKISRRSFLLGLGAVSTAALLAACGEAASSAPASSAASSEAPASSASEVSAAPILTEDEFPVTDGSTACIPLMAQMMADTTGIDLEVAQSAVTTNTTAWAWRNLGLYGDTENGTRLIIAYEAPESVKEELKADGAPLEQKPIGRDALVFIVNENNPVKSLTRQQLKDIYAGKITNWKEVGGEDLAIVPFQRGEDSGSQTLFRKLLIQGSELMDPPTELAPAMGELVDSIAAYNNSANAIGFSVYYYIDQMYSQPGLRLLAVDGVTPSNDTIASESYPLCNEFYAAVRQDSGPDTPERKVYDWLSTDAGRACIQKSGYVAAQ
ncbi:substrate-binding domain-containing protein [Faecalibacterium prausnitzii]|uniref:substrate-binding domain-containing protein n=1 Tax=Faecalibacterium prausnitzii TaxID=853 RepID=UPI003C2B0B6F